MATTAATANQTANRTTLTLGAACWLVAAVGYVILELLAAAAVPGYSYTEQYISSLGVPAWSPRWYLMNGAFFGQAVLFVAGALLVARAVGARWTGMLFVALAVITAAGDFLVGIVYGGSPLWNDGQEWLHALGAILAILGGNAAILAGTAVAGRAIGTRLYRVVGTLIGVAGLVMLAVLQNYNHWAVDYVPIGLVERACVYTIMLWQLITALALLRRRG